MITTREYLELDKKNPWYATEYDGDREADKELIREYNKALMEKYPWLEPTNAWSGKKIVACARGEKGFWPNDQDELPKYDFEFTELDNMPAGWRLAFGDEMCERLQAELEKFDFVDEFRITQIKEKYGSLRFYVNCAPADSKIFDIIGEYEDLSETTCIRCGKSATHISTGWISPWCGDCKKDIEAEGRGNRFVTIDEYFKREKEE